MPASENSVGPANVTLTPEQQKEELDQALQRMDKLAESELQMARLFIDRGKTDIARRRLHSIMELYEKSASAKEARTILKKLK